MPATQAEIESALIDFIRENILAEGVEFSPETALSHIGVDSYSVIELVLFIERRFGVVMPENKLVPKNLKSVRALAECTVQMLP